TDEGLFRVPASGGTPVAVAKPDVAHREQSYSWPEWLPGGQAIVFSLKGRGLAAIAAVPIGGGAPKVIVPVGTNPRWSQTGHLLYVADGVLCAVGFDASALEVRGDAVRFVEGIQTKALGAANMALAGDGTLLY